jgi:hypothetical protein
VGLQALLNAQSRPRNTTCSGRCIECAPYLRHCDAAPCDTQLCASSFSDAMRRIDTERPLPSVQRNPFDMYAPRRR